MPLLKLWNSLRGQATNSAPSHPGDTQAPQERSTETNQSSTGRAVKSAPKSTFGIFRGGPHSPLQKRLRALSVSSVLEIGCASNAFVGRMTWMAKKTCVAPYHAGYANADGRNGSGTIGAASDDGVEYVGADFATWRVERAYDFCVCMQVLEHVDDPTKFFRKMLDPRVCRRAVLVSVPYKWGDCGEKCSHRWHGIDEDVVGAWSGVREPAQTTVIREREGTARLIVVYALNDGVVV